jgi:hypothetical protein
VFVGEKYASPLQPDKRRATIKTVLKRWIFMILPLMKKTRRAYPEGIAFMKFFIDG